MTLLRTDPATGWYDVRAPPVMYWKGSWNWPATEAGDPPLRASARDWERGRPAIGSEGWRRVAGCSARTYVYVNGEELCSLSVAALLGVLDEVVPDRWRARDVGGGK